MSTLRWQKHFYSLFFQFVGDKISGHIHDKNYNKQFNNLTVGCLIGVTHFKYL